MNKLKATIQELRDYLGSDRKGLSLLNEITEVANAQRKRAASLEEATTAIDANARALRTKLDSAESEVLRLKQELSRESARLSACEDRERKLQSQLKSQGASDLEESADRPTSLDFAAQVSALMKVVLRRFSRLPACARGRAGHGGIYVEDFVKSFKYDEFAGLGMVMALCSMMNTPVQIKSERPLDPLVLSDSERERYMLWFRKAIYYPESQRQLDARFNSLADKVGR